MKGLDYTALTVAIIGAVNWGLIGFLPPRPRRPDLRKHDVAEPHHLRGCRHLRPLPDFRLRKNFRPRTGTGVRTGTLSYTQRKAV